MECLRGLFEYWIIGKVMITRFLQTQVTDSQDGNFWVKHQGEFQVPLCYVIASCRGSMSR
jgi:hypothetical protein